jgi:hypothetical protein
VVLQQTCSWLAVVGGAFEVPLDLMACLPEVFQIAAEHGYAFLRGIMN